jgi:hypothetical protein
MIPNFVVTHSKLLTELHVGTRDRLVVQVTEDKLLLVIAPIREHPHPLANTSDCFVSDFDFNVVASFVSPHFGPQYLNHHKL